MSDIRACLRLAPGAPEELEWFYLISETLAGERCIVPLLESLRKKGGLPNAFYSMLDRQIAEEVDHVEKYQHILPNCKQFTTGFANDFARIIEGIDSVTLQLFALQGFLESISIGTLHYRQGLAAVRQIVESHQGTIECQSSVDDGTVFIMEFPLGKGARSRVTFEAQGMNL